jgi:hypothetical protein
MLCAGFGHDPDGGGGFEGGEVGEQLSQVVVVATLQLVLDDDGATIVVLGHEVDGECTGGLLAFGAGQGCLQVFVQDFEVVLQPDSEVQRASWGQTSRRGTRRRRPTETLRSSMLGILPGSPSGPKDAAAPQIRSLEAAGNLASSCKGNAG